MGKRNMYLIIVLTLSSEVGLLLLLVFRTRFSPSKHENIRENIHLSNHRSLEVKLERFRGQCTCQLWGALHVCWSFVCTELGIILQEKVL